jgi:hypothetical protein
MGGLFTLPDPLPRRPALGVEVDDGAIRPGERGHDDADPGEELSQVILDLGDHPSRPVPRRGLILEVSVPHQPTLVDELVVYSKRDAAAKPGFTRRLPLLPRPKEPASIH